MKIGREKGCITANEALFAERLKWFDDAVALKEPDRVPIAPMMGVYPFWRYGSSWKDTMYDYEVANAAAIKFHEEYQPDCAITAFSHSGKANEIAGSTMCDWPGRPGTSVQDVSTYQMIEWEYLEQETAGKQRRNARRFGFSAGFGYNTSQHIKCRLRQQAALLLKAREYG